MTKNRFVRIILKIPNKEECLCHRDTLPIKVIQLNNLPECRFAELNYDNKIVFIATLSLSQYNDANKFNLFFVLITGGFKICCNNWCGVGNVNNNEGIINENLTSSYGMHVLGRQQETRT